MNSHEARILFNDRVRTLAQVIRSAEHTNRVLRQRLSDVERDKRLCEKQLLDTNDRLVETLRKQRDQRRAARNESSNVSDEDLANAYEAGRNFENTCWLNHLELLRDSLSRPCDPERTPDLSRAPDGTAFSVGKDGYIHFEDGTVAPIMV